MADGLNINKKYYTSDIRGLVSISEIHGNYLHLWNQLYITVSSVSSPFQWNIIIVDYYQELEVSIVVINLSVISHMIEQETIKEQLKVQSGHSTDQEGQPQ